MSSEKEARETAVMTVESFSQLPFLRPAPQREKTTTSTSKPPIRLFGFEVPQEPNSTSIHYATTHTIKSNEITAAAGDAAKKFSCRYCCRNFPTSQALGGHQNAHKRERQHAKRLQFQSSMASSHHHGTIVEGQVISFHSLSSFPYFSEPSWNPSNGGVRTTVLQPINGNPVPFLSRAHGGVANIIPPFLGGDEFYMVGGLTDALASSSSTSTPPRYLHESSFMAKDNNVVSLDLRL
ncbi:hypothetical protein J5N97_009452 [Dioscorea zingiberensis]|uniref:C2H2-type domain-containing protein n=1 Tax=Dioscorea zingiberensis TaxID=325984 RepID=A0A9D5HMP6_9LILI|nr:hypothetical protein J5N97_009452 [Dioscorea zingiberensis]